MKLAALVLEDGTVLEGQGSGVESVSGLIESGVPILGICLGH